MRILVASRPQRVIDYVGERAYQDYFGLLTTPRDGRLPTDAIALGVPWAIDNFAFSNFDPAGFENFLKRMQGYPGCKWVAVPDVVGNALATLEQFMVWHGIIRSYGFPLALVAQDGLQDLSISWNMFEALFVGGSTQWKLGQSAKDIVCEAKLHGKWVHMGRVNSLRRLRYAHSIGCDSVDGSGFARFTKKVVQAMPALCSTQLILGGF